MALGAGLVWLFGIGTPSAMTFPRPFDSGGWKAYQFGSNGRSAMVADLRNRIGLTGKTVPEVVGLLGKDIDGSIDPPNVYALCPSLGDLYILEIDWRNGRVVSTVVRDT